MVAKDFEEFRLRNIEAEGFAGDFQLVIVDVAVFVEVEECELGFIQHAVHFFASLLARD